MYRDVQLWLGCGTTAGSAICCMFSLFQPCALIQLQSSGIYRYSQNRLSCSFAAFRPMNISSMSLSSGFRRRKSPLARPSSLSLLQIWKFHSWTLSRMIPNGGCHKLTALHIMGISFSLMVLTPACMPLCSVLSAGLVRYAFSRFLVYVIYWSFGKKYHNSMNNKYDNYIVYAPMRAAVGTDWKEKSKNPLTVRKNRF